MCPGPKLFLSGPSELFCQPIPLTLDQFINHEISDTFTPPSQEPFDIPYSNKCSPEFVLTIPLNFERFSDRL
jgi:hypothetical protein